MGIIQKLAQIRTFLILSECPRRIIASFFRGHRESDQRRPRQLLQRAQRQQQQRETAPNQHLHHHQNIVHALQSRRTPRERPPPQNQRSGRDFHSDLQAKDHPLQSHGRNPGYHWRSRRKLQGRKFRDPKIPLLQHARVPGDPAEDPLGQVQPLHFLAIGILNPKNIPRDSRKSP